MRHFSPKLMRLLVIKGLCRFGPPFYILWSIFEWSRIDWRYAVGFAALTLNYVLVNVLTWVAPALMNGPWRVRPWQTLILLANVFVLPILHHRKFGQMPWIFFASALLCAASLIVGSAIYVYLHERLPAGALLNPRQQQPQAEA